MCALTTDSDAWELVRFDDRAAAPLAVSAPLALG
jgi:hypothetical protein